MRFQNLLLLATLLAFSLSYADITNASIVWASDQTLTNMSWESTTMKAYVDGEAGNPDVTLMACGTQLSDVQNKYATFVYRMGNLSGFTLIATEPTNNYTQLTNCSGTCCWGKDFYNFISLFAIYPANIYAIISNDPTFDESDTFVYVGPKTHLRGYYTQSNLESSYVQSTGNVTFNVGANDVKSWNGNEYAINSEDQPYFYLGVCDITPNLYYWGCQGGYAGARRGVAYSVHTGVVSPPDSITTTKYWVINGMGTQFCIGPDPKVNSVSVTPATQYSGGTLNITVVVSNNGNVDITHEFNVTVNVSGVDVRNISIPNLPAHSTTTSSFNLTLENYHSGVHTVGARIAQTTVADCNTTNNYSSTNFTVIPSYRVYMYINGVESNTFPDAGRPYNISVRVKDTDGNDADVLVRIYEVNGINLFAPLQVISTTPPRGLRAVSYGESRTNADGMTNFTIIPTGNKLYTPEYAYTGISNYVGNYSLYIKTFNATSGVELQQTNGTALIDQFNITLQNMSVRTPEPNEHPITVDNQDDYVQLMTEFMNDVFANVAKWWLQ